MKTLFMTTLLTLSALTYAQSDFLVLDEKGSVSESDQDNQFIERLGTSVEFTTEEPLEIFANSFCSRIIRNGVISNDSHSNVNRDTNKAITGFSSGESTSKTINGCHVCINQTFSSMKTIPTGTILKPVKVISHATDYSSGNYRTYYAIFEAFKGNIQLAFQCAETASSGSTNKHYTLKEIKNEIGSIITIEVDTADHDLF